MFGNTSAKRILELALPRWRRGDRRQLALKRSSRTGLFGLRANPGSTGLPHGEIGGGRITIGIEGRNDPETLKRETDRQEQFLREFVGQSLAQIDRRNAELERLLPEAIARR